MDFDKYDHFSFDLDGTLIDSIPSMECAWERVMEKFKIDVGFSDYKTQIGKPFKKILFNLNIEDPWSEIERFYFSNTLEMVSRTRAFHGVHEFLESVRAVSKSTSIITSKPRSNVSPILDTLGLHVDVVVCSDDVSLGKPFPMALDVVEKEIGELDRSRTIYFGDVLSDLIFAVNCGVKYCHCNFGAYGKLDANLLPEEMHISSWKQLCE